MTDVLGIAPHPDDLELSAGGTVAGLTAAGFRVVFVDLTEGERATRGTPELRREEAARAADVLGLAGRENLHLPDGGLDSRHDGQLRAVVQIVRRHRPRLVIGMHENDEHPDHQEGAFLVRRALYLAGLRNWPEPDGEPHRTPRCIFAMGRRTFEPSFIVDVTETHHVKRRAMAAFHSQLHRDAHDPNVTPISDPGFLKALEARDRHYGAVIGGTFGEPFWSDRPWGMAPEGLLRP